MLPLPMWQYTCPREISITYGNFGFNNDCDISTSDCKKFRTLECWTKFYGEAKTIKQKQDVLKRIRKR